MRLTTARDGNVFEFAALLHPGTIYAHPRDVVSDPALTLGEKRAILASWASDALSRCTPKIRRWPPFIPEAAAAALLAFGSTVVPEV
jgi:hypothetical protein